MLGIKLTKEIFPEGFQRTRSSWWENESIRILVLPVTLRTSLRCKTRHFAFMLENDRLNYSQYYTEIGKWMNEVLHFVLSSALVALHEKLWRVLF